MPITTPIMRRLLIIPILMLSLPPFAHAQEISLDRLQIYVQADTVKIDASIDSLFSQRSLNAIASGMTASITLHFRLVTARGERLSETALYRRLEHDIWEGAYRFIEFSDPPDTLVTRHFDIIKQTSAEIQGLPIAPLPLPEQVLTLQTRIHVDPITPEQQERTRSWLNILQKGSLIEFFFSLEKAPPRWVTLVSFRPSALPHMLQETQP